MIGRKTRLLVAGLFGLLVALAANSAVGSIILHQPPADELFAPAAGADAGQAMTPDAPRPSVPPDDPQNPPTIQHLEGLAPSGGSAGQPSSGPQGGGNGSNIAAMTAALYDLPQTPLQTGLPGEPRTIMPIGPPFELLRPPRSM